MNNLIAHWIEDNYGSKVSVYLTENFVTVRSAAQSGDLLLGAWTFTFHRQCVTQEQIKTVLDALVK